METRSKKKLLIEKDNIATEYEKMFKVRVLLHRFNFDAFQKTVENISSNKNGTDNVSKFHKSTKTINCH